MKKVLEKPYKDTRAVTEVVQNNYVTLPIDYTVGQALRHIRTQARRGDIFYLYVIDPSAHLVGIVSIRNLLLSTDSEPVANVVSRNVVYLNEDTSRLEAAQRFADCRFLSLPVVSPEGKILGVVHAHDLTDTYSHSKENLFEERTRGALFELLGIEAEDSSVSVWKAARRRFPWLLINMAGGSLSAFLIHRLAPDLPTAVQFLAFVPILLIICESIGMQTVSIVINKLQHAQGQLAKSAYRELRIAGLLGVASALLVGIVVQLAFGNTAVALGVGISMSLATVLVSAIAFSLPVLTRRLGIDPSVSAGPVVLAIADSATLALYLGVAYLTCKFLM